MIQKFSFIPFFLLYFTTNIFANTSDVVFEFHNRGGILIPKLYCNSGNHLFYTLRDTKGKLLSTKNVSFEVKKGSVISKNDSLIVFYPIATQDSTAEVIVKYYGKIIHSQRFTLVKFSPPSFYISYDSLGQRKVDEAQPIFLVDKLYLKLLPDIEFRTICAAYGARFAAEVTVYRKGKVIFNQRTWDVINLEDINMRTQDNIRVFIREITLVNNSDFCIPALFTINKKFELVVR